MDIILIFFILPLATIILAAVLEYLIRCPIAVAAIFFAIWLVVAYLIFTTEVFVIALVVYTILAFLSAVITRLILCNCNRLWHNCPVCMRDNCPNDEVESIEDINDNDNNNGSNNNNNCNCRNTRYSVRRVYR